MMSRQVNFRKKGEKPPKRKKYTYICMGDGKTIEISSPLITNQLKLRTQTRKKKMKAEKEIFVRA